MLPILHRTLAWSNLPREVNLSLPRPHFLSLWISMYLSVLADGEDSHLGFVFSKCSHRLHIYLSNLQSRTPAAGIRNGHRQIVGAYAVSIQGRTVYCRASQPCSHRCFRFRPRVSLRCYRLSSSTPASSAISTQADLRSLGEGDSASVSATVAALENVYTDADLLETICQIRGDELDDAGTHELVHHIRAPVASSSSFLFEISGSSRNENSSTLTRSRESLACLAQPHLAPRCCVSIGITSLSGVGLAKLACAMMDPSAPLQSFASPKRMPRASTSHACIL
jgi:hypothetical protein